MLCHRGCGKESAYTNYKGLPCCHKSAQSCPVVKRKVGAASGATRRKNPCLRSEEYKVAQAERVKQQYVDGKRGKVETIEKIRESNKKTWALNPRAPWNKGLTGVQVPWNKGLKKKESLEILARDSEVYSNFKKYRNRVAVRTRKTYEQFKDEINPDNLPLGKCGIDGAHQIDHIITVRQGFEAGTLIETISAKENLQIMPWLENLQKYDGKGLRRQTKKR